MQSRVFLLGAVGALLALGCSSRATRIREQPQLFQSLDAATQQKIQRGEIELGYTPEMVRLALGQPGTIEPAGDHDDATWTYRNLHRDRKDQIRGGYRRRIVFDPVIRGETVVVEPIDDQLAAKLAPQSLRLTFRDGRLAAIEKMPER